MLNRQINEDLFFRLLNQYYSIKMRDDIELVKELTVKYDSLGPYPDLGIYYESYIAGDKIRVKLSYEDIFEALDVYAQNQGLELVDFKYDGGVRKMGLQLDKDIPYFTGVCLRMREKSLVKKLFRK